MSWTTPKTWLAGSPLLAADLNTHLRDNLNALKAPPTANQQVNEASDYSTTSGSFVDVDTTDLALTITTTGGDVMIGFAGALKAPSNNGANLDVLLDGVRIGGDDGITSVTNDYDGTYTERVNNASFVYLKRSLGAGSHTFKLQWKSVSGNTVTMPAGAGSVGGNDLHPQFWVREVS
ncbi:MAG: hypothetical protein IT320_05360 [Anaerolineae bacterium]|nr:hypothetical protein [Anaerolineae bacterium]